MDWDYITTAPADVIRETAGQDLNEDSPGPHDHAAIAKAGVSSAGGNSDNAGGCSGALLGGWVGGFAGFACVMHRIFRAVRMNLWATPRDGIRMTRPCGCVRKAGTTLNICHSTMARVANSCC